MMSPLNQKQPSASFDNESILSLGKGPLSEQALQGEINAGRATASIDPSSNKIVIKPTLPTKTSVKTPTKPKYSGSRYTTSSKLF